MFNQDSAKRIDDKLGPIVRGEDNKDHMLFPRKN
jgi:hypothetical protein